MSTDVLVFTAPRQPHHLFSNLPNVTLPSWSTDASNGSSTPSSSFDTPSTSLNATLKETITAVASSQITLTTELSTTIKNANITPAYDDSNPTLGLPGLYKWRDLLHAELLSFHDKTNEEVDQAWFSAEATIRRDSTLTTSEKNEAKEALRNQLGRLEKMVLTPVDVLLKKRLQAGPLMFWKGDFEDAERLRGMVEGIVEAWEGKSNGVVSLSNGN